ncbi:radical SAM protein [Gemmatimonas sp.]|uniref:radical SAM protein n=1 Tax=Gemmatimonas sp. TaxID=1962908 RepID=UPI003983CA39
MNIGARITRHARLSLRAREHRPRETPPFLIVFINSICNLTCEHCFYWKDLNKRNDLTFAEFETLSKELGTIEVLNLSGGEPFINKEFAEICTLFVKNNQAKQIYVPTNGYFTDKTEKAVRKVLADNPELQLFAVELSLDGMPEYHNRFRGNPKSFEQAMETYEMLVTLQAEDPRLRIHSNTVAMSENMEEIRQLAVHLHERCPKMEHQNLAVIRGDRKNPSLTGPAIDAYADLFRYVAHIWADREVDRFGTSVEPMLQWAKVETMRTESQFIPCKAGILSGVIYANGDVSLCETRAPLGNLREKGFFEIWDSPEAVAVREQIEAKQCYCTTEVFMWPSIVFQPVQLTRAFIGAKRMWGKND